MHLVAFSATVPTGATTGTITVTTPGGTVTSATSFTVVAAPTITSFTPTSGAIGIPVTLTGTNFTGAIAVKFNGTTATTFSVTNATTLSATVPTGATTGTIAVTTPGGTATSSSSFTLVTPPVQPVLTAPGSVIAGQTGYTSSVPTQVAATYAWTVNSGTITAGSSTNQITFTPFQAGSLVTARSGHTANALSTGKVLISGGTGPSGNLLGSAELYNPATGTSTATGSLVKARSNHAAVTLGTGSVLVLGGYGSAAPLASAELFNPSTSKFTATTGSMTTARTYPAVVLLANGNVLVTGGYDGNGNRLATAETFNPTTGTFTAVAASMTATRVAHTATLLANGRVLLVGGQSDGPGQSTAEVYDPNAGTFTLVPGCLNAPRYNHTGTLLGNGTVLVAGGYNAIGAPLGSAEIYAPVSGTFSQVPLLATRAEHTATLLPNGQVLLAGGLDASSNANGSAELFNPTTSSSVLLPGLMNTGRFGHTATPMANGQVLFTGGLGSLRETLASSDSFDPGSGLLSGCTLTCTVSNTAGTSQPGTAGVQVCPLLTLTAPASLIAGQAGYSASVPTYPGYTYVWTVTNGTLDQGAGTGTISFTPSAAGTLNLSCSVTDPSAGIHTTSLSASVWPSQVVLSPMNPVVAPGGSQALTANQPVTWSCSAGTLTTTSTTATFKAIANGSNLGAGTYQVWATSVTNPALTGTAFITVATAGTPTITSFTASPATIHDGQSTTLSWTTTNAVTVMLDGIGTPITGNSVTISPNATTTVVLDAFDAQGDEAQAGVLVTVDQVPTIRALEASNYAPALGAAIQLTAVFSGGTAVLMPGAIAVQSGVPLSLTPTGSTKFTLTVTNAWGGTTSAFVQITVVRPGILSALPDMPNLQAWPASTPLADGRVLFTGGTTDGPRLNQLFDPSTGLWSQGPNLTYSRGGATATQFPNGKVLVWGGDYPNEGTNYFTFVRTFELLDLAAGLDSNFMMYGTYAQVYRMNHSSTLLSDGSILIAGGFTPPADGSSVTVNNLPTDATALIVVPETAVSASPSWQSTGSMITSRGGHAAIRLMDGRVLIAGGNNCVQGSGRTALTSAEIYDPSTRIWSAAGNLNDSSNACGPILLPSGKVLFNGNELFDPSTLTFTQLGAQGLFSIWRWGTTVVLPNGLILDLQAPGTPVLVDPVLGQFFGVSGGISGFASGSLSPLPDGTVLVGPIATSTGNSSTPTTQMERFDSQVNLKILPALASTNVNVPLTLQAAGSLAGAVSWNCTGGAVSAGGTFRAQAPGRYTVTATASGGVTATAWIEVNPPVQVVIDGASYPKSGSSVWHAHVPGTFSARVLQTPNQGLTWSLQEGAVAGTLTADGIFTPVAPGTWHVVATSILDPTQSAVATAQIGPAIQLTLAPASQTLYVGQQAQYSVSEPSGATAYVPSCTGGTWVNGILYQAPTAPGTYLLTVTSTLDPTQSASAIVHVVPFQSFTISPGAGVLAVGASLPVSATVVTTQGNLNVTSQVAWSASGGTVAYFADYVGATTGTELYFAPSTPGSYTLTATLPGTQVIAQVPITVLANNAFQVSGSPLVGRNFPTLTRLLDSTILVTGGAYSAVAERFDPVALTFTETSGPMSRVRQGATASLMADGRVLVVGGEIAHVPGTSDFSAEIYDPATGRFNPTANPPLFFRQGHAATLLPDGKVLLGGGTDEYSGKSLETFDPVTGQFALAGWLEEPLPMVQAALLGDGRVLFAGSSGSVAGTVPGLDQLFDFRTGSVTASGRGLVGRDQFWLLRALDDQVWTLGGLAGTECFNPATGQVTAGPTLPGPLYAATQLVDGSIYSFSGLSYTLNGNSRMTGMRLFPSSGQWAAAFSPDSSPATTWSQVLLPTGSVLLTGSDYSSGNAYANLVITDCAPNLAVQPAHVTLMEGRSWPFQASATGGGSGTQAIWTVQEAQGGSVSAQGVYTAPFIPGTYHVQATLGSLTAQARVEVVPAIEVCLAPALTELAPSGQVTFTASVTGVQTPHLTWSASAGQIDTSGAYTAPAAEGTYTVTATSLPDGHAATATVLVGSGAFPLPAPVILNFTTDTPAVELGQPAKLSWNVLGAYQLLLNGVDVTGLSGIAVVPTDTTTYRLQAVNPTGSTYSQVLTITVSTQPVSLAITPATLTLMAGMSEQMGFSLVAPSNRLIWSASAGTVSATGFFTAPNAPGTCTITAQSVDDPTRTSTCAITVIDDLLKIEPITVTLDRNQVLQFGYRFSGPSGAMLTWSATGGLITQSGLYVAPAVPGTYTVSLASSSDPSLVQSSTVTVSATPSIQVVPGSTSVAPGATATFSAVVRSGGVTWSVLPASGGTITQAGVYQAPLVSGTYTVVAVSNLDGATYGTAQVLVGVGAGGGGASGGTSTGTGVSGAQITLAPSFVNTQSGTYWPFSASVTGCANTAVTWSILGSPTTAQIDPSGVFSASKPGSYQVVASSNGDPTATVTASVNVASSLTLLPDGPDSGLFWGYSVTALQDGRVLIAGGIQMPQDGAVCDRWGNVNYVSSGQAQIFDPATGQLQATGSMLTPRNSHQAVLLDDGRVLMMGGSAQWHDPWSTYAQLPPQEGIDYTTWNEKFPSAEVYNPVSGTFQALPGNSYDPTGMVDNSRIPTSIPFALPGLMLSTHGELGSCLKLSNHQVIAFGGDGEGWWSDLLGVGLEPGLWTTDGFDCFTPGPDTFNPKWSGKASWPGWILTNLEGMSLGFGQGSAAVNLQDGNALLCLGALNDRGYGYGGFDPTTFTSAASSLNAIVYTPSSGAYTLTSPMQVPRFAHTLTQLPDGRILAVGGKDMRQTQPEGGYWSSNVLFWASTPTAEIYDPATQKWTLTGSMKTARDYHAAQLLPNGQVLIVGGSQEDLYGNVQFPNTTELYDPTTGTFSVMDTLDYGISSPQLAMMNNGAVFVAGQYEPPMNPPQAASPAPADTEMKVRITPMADVGATTLSGSNLDGVINTCRSGITITWHYVVNADGAPIFVYAHSALRIIPTNQNKWSTDPVWGDLFNKNPLLGGNHYITLSAEPLNLPNALENKNTPMISRINKPSDLGQQAGYLVSNFACDVQHEDALILKLLNTFSGYVDNVNYVLIPRDFNPPSITNQYNSNSFTHGLINAVGLGSFVSPVPDSEMLIFPGWNSPLPLSFFFNNN